ncbi:MAG: GTPase Era [Actinomycetia bacterium]|nr:GTPase Era [Actinomycetes bacterium]
MENKFKSGFVGIIGRTNVGKSTLVNNLVQQKVAIISPKPQTTRRRIRCVVNRDNYQMIFIDAPGIHKPRDRLGERLNAAALGFLEEMDVILFMIEASGTIGKGDRFISEKLKSVNRSKILVINKIDLIDEDEIERKISKAKKLGIFEEIIPISAKYNKNLDQLLEILSHFLPYGQPYFPEDMLTDQHPKIWVSEIIREKALENLREEVPHSIAVEVEKMEKRKDKDIIDLEAIIYVERNSQKGIVIGKNGSMLKRIGSSARKEIELFLGIKVFMRLWVKVKKDWRKDESSIKRFGYAH